PRGEAADALTGISGSCRRVLPGVVMICADRRANKLCPLFPAPSPSPPPLTPQPSPSPPLPPSPPPPPPLPLQKLLTPARPKDGVEFEGDCEGALDGAAASRFAPAAAAMTAAALPPRTVVITPSSETSSLRPPPGKLLVTAAAAAAAAAAFFPAMPSASLGLIEVPATGGNDNDLIIPSAS
ncbi:hypothetical protein Vafri_15534, partial [Volvox africanus]